MRTIRNFLVVAATLAMTGCASFSHDWGDGQKTTLRTLFKKYEVQVQPTDPPTIRFASGIDPIYINVPGYGEVVRAERD